ncbi:CvfD/Ygs/GSP13 family RNA-binding post-transcriptional regulator [Trichococcus palustris]|jgi:general stress protein 13|nr:CvfD/Ygs/GSP13 family RNA-binding post-transcriptional regulator [Trichococcus palustris]
MKYKIGDIIEGKVTGIQAYGVFISLDKNTQGLIHISECRHGYVTDLDGFIQIDDEVEAKIIDIDEYTGKISLSLRAMEKLPIPPYPAKRKRRKRRYVPQIGFDTLKQKIPAWIEEAKEDEKVRKSIGE